MRTAICDKQRSRATRSLPTHRGDVPWAPAFAGVTPVGSDPSPQRHSRGGGNPGHRAAGVRSPLERCGCAQHVMPDARSARGMGRRGERRAQAPRLWFEERRLRLPLPHQGPECAGQNEPAGVTPGGLHAGAPWLRPPARAAEAPLERAPPREPRQPILSHPRRAGISALRLVRRRQTLGECRDAETAVCVAILRIRKGKVGPPAITRTP